MKFVNQEIVARKGCVMVSRIRRTLAEANTSLIKAAETCSLFSSPAPSSLMGPPLHSPLSSLPH